MAELASSAGNVFLDAADLGLSPDDEQCRALAEELGSEPPWSVVSLKLYFDSRFPGWDEAPTLSLSSPLSRLRVLAQAFPSVEAGGLANDDGHAEEALRELGREVKHAQIRITCHRGEAPLQDECNLLLIVLGQVGALLRSERQGRIREREAAAHELAALRDALRSASQDAMTAAQEETKARLDEFEHEAEVQREELIQLNRELQAFREKEQQITNWELRCEALEQEATHWKQAHSSLQEDMREVKAQRAALAVAHEESEGALDELTRRLSRSNSQMEAAAALNEKVEPSATDAVSSHLAPAAPTSVSCAAAPVQRSEAFMSGARAALTLSSSADKDALRPALLAWRCARLEGLYSRIGEAAAATSLEADLCAVGGKCKLGQSGCCCGNGMDCCRGKWLTTSLHMLQKERVLRFSAETAANLAKKRSAYIGMFATVALLLLFLAWIEPRLMDGW